MRQRRDRGGWYSSRSVAQETTASALSSQSYSLLLETDESICSSGDAQSPGVAGPRIPVQMIRTRYEPVPRAAIFTASTGNRAGLNRVEGVKERAMNRLIIPLLCLASWCQLLSADALDRKRLPADTKWFIHLDAAAARNWPVAQTFREAFLSHGDARQGMQFIKSTFGIDPLEDILEVTAYNTSFTPNEVVIVARAKTLDKDKLLSLLRYSPDFREANHEKHKVYSWTEQKGDRAGQTTCGTFIGDDTVAIGPGEAAVNHLLDVLDGAAASAADKPASLPDLGEQDVVLEAAAVGLAEARALAAKSPVVKEAESIVLAAGDHQGMTFLRGELKTRTPQVAAKIEKVLMGLQAFAELQMSDNPDVTQFVSPGKVTVDGTTVRVDWQVSDEQVVKRIKAEIAKHPSATDE